MFCSECGQQNADDNKYCMKCGKKLVTEQTVSSLSEATVKPVTLVSQEGDQTNSSPSVDSKVHVSTELKESGTVTAMSVIGLVFGLIGMLGSFIPCLGSFAFYIALPAAIASGIGLGIAYSQNAKRTFAIVALTISLIGVVISGWQLYSIASVGQSIISESRRIGESANKQQSSPPMSIPSVSETNIPLPKAIEISSRAVWQPNGDEWERIYQVCDGSKENQIQCIASEMRKNGASGEAITFTQMMKGEVYLSSFMNKGILGIGTITAPVLNDPNVTEPIIIYEGNKILKPSEYFSKINISQAREYNDVVQKYPKVEIWPMGDLVEVQNLNNGEMSCIFSYLLLNGCRACEVAGKAIVAFDFDKKGFFKGQRLLKIEKSL